MTTATTKVHLVHVEDHEGDGTCGTCGREGLRWIAVLSDGQRLGFECAKAALGYKPAPRDFAWQAHFTLTEVHHEYGDTYGLWRAKVGGQTRETRNGHLTQVGGVPAEWSARGWL